MGNIDWSTVLAAVFSSGVISILVTLWIARGEKSDRKRSIELAEQQIRLDQHKERLRLLDEAASVMSACETVLDNIEAIRTYIDADDDADDYLVAPLDNDTTTRVDDTMSRASIVFGDLMHHPDMSDLLTSLAALNTLITVYLDEDKPHPITKTNYEKFKAKFDGIVEEHRDKAFLEISRLRALPAAPVAVRRRSLLARVTRRKEPETKQLPDQPPLT